MDKSLNYEQCEDIVLISKAQCGDQRAYSTLIEKYEKLCYAATRGLFLYGAGREDLLQSCRIGLYKAILTYSADKGSFIPYAKTCIKGAAIDALKTYNRNKQLPLKNTADINEPSVENMVMLTTLEDDFLENHLKDKINTFLTHNMEKEDLTIFNMYMEGYTYKDIGKKLDINVKKVDNRLIRIKALLKELLKDEVNI